jgi:hypothetical protein
MKMYRSYMYVMGPKPHFQPLLGHFKPLPLHFQPLIRKGATPLATPYSMYTFNPRL